MNKLLLCPFCGSEARTFNDPSLGTAWTVVCQHAECDCNARIPYCHSEEEAIRQWNRRVATEVESATAALLAQEDTVRLAQRAQRDAEAHLVECEGVSLLRKKGGETWERQARELEAEAIRERERADGLERLFALQQTRMDKAMALWREAMWREGTGKYGVMPDLGDLLDWLMFSAAQERERAERAETDAVAWQRITESETRRADKHDDQLQTAEVRIEALEGCVRRMGNKQAEALELLRKVGYIYNDTNDPMQKLVFSLYADLVMISQWARAVLGDEAALLIPSDEPGGEEEK